MDLKLGKTLLLLTAFIVFSHSNFASAENSDSWNTVYPERFDSVEQFFLQQGCSFYQSAAYFYNLEEAHWLSYTESISIYPELEGVLTNIESECELSATVDELSQLINIEAFTDTGIVLLYFDVARDADGDPRSLFTPSMLKNYQNKLDRLSEFEATPKYRIIASRVGFRAQ